MIIKEYRERFKMERDLRVTKEMELREYRERYKMERELCADKDRELLAVKDELRRVKKQKKKLVNIVNIMQAKLNVCFLPYILLNFISWFIFFLIFSSIDGTKD